MWNVNKKIISFRFICHSKYCFRRECLFKYNSSRNSHLVVVKKTKNIQKHTRVESSSRRSRCRAYVIIMMCKCGLFIIISFLQIKAHIFYFPVTENLKRSKLKSSFFTHADVYLIIRRVNFSNMWIIVTINIYLSIGANKSSGICYVLIMNRSWSGSQALRYF